MRFLFLYFVILLLAFRWPIFSTKVVATEKEAINIRMMCPSSSVFRILAHSRIEYKVKVYLCSLYLFYLALSLFKKATRLQTVFLVVGKSCTQGCRKWCRLA